MFLNSRSYPLYLFVSGAFAMYSTVAAVYRIETVGLDPVELVLVGTALEATVLLFEVPYGCCGRRPRAQAQRGLGLRARGAGFALEGSVPTFAAVLAAQVLWGSLTSWSRRTACCRISSSTSTASSRSRTRR